MPYKTYGESIFQNSLFDLHGSRSGSKLNLWTKSERVHIREAHTRAKIDLLVRGFIMKTWPGSSRRESKVHRPGKLGFGYFKINYIWICSTDKYFNWEFFRLVPLHTSCWDMPLELNLVHRGQYSWKNSKHLIVPESTTKFGGIIGTIRTFFQGTWYPR